MFREYVEAGLAICAISFENKAPTYKAWNRIPIDADVADGIDGAGLLHVQSGTCALDIDDITKARPWLAERGVDLDELLAAPDAVRISSGRRGRAKLLYRLKKPLRTLKPKNSGMELRCATVEGASTQDVLPPSIHPDTHKPYVWEFGDELLGDWRRLPSIPAGLKAAWRALLDEEPVQARKLNGHVDVALQKLEDWIAPKDPNMEYDEWLKVGMKLHDATGGAEEGLAIWDDWSAKATRSKNGRSIYHGDSTCRTHWISFSSTPGKIVATVNNELPADADEFEVVETEHQASETTTETKMRETAQQKKKAAIKALEDKVVYVVNSEKYFDVDRHRVIGSDSALEHLFTSTMPMGKNGRMNPVKILKASTTKRLVEGLGFHPGEGALFTVGNDTFANLYRNRLPEPVEPSKEDYKRINWLFERIDDAVYATWLRQFFGHVVQKPGVKIKSAPLIWSDTQRNGKTTLLKTLPSLLVGPEFSTDVSYDLLTSPFNDYLQGAWHVNLTEFRANARGERTMIGNKLKAYIADDMIPFHPKGSRGYGVPNHFFVTASSNEDDAAAIDNNDERWGIHELRAPKFTEREREWIYYSFLNTPRAAAVLRHYFLHIDLKGFHATGSAPMTAAKEEMAESSRTPDIELLTTMLEERAEFFDRDVVLTSEVTAYVHKHSTVRPSAKRIGKILTKSPFLGSPIKFRDGSATFRGVIIRNKAKWTTDPGSIMAHIRGDDEFDLLS